MEWIYEPWPWYVGGILIAMVMLFLLIFGKSFGFSDNLRTLCTIAGADEYATFFKFDWHTRKWNLFFLVGAFLGGFISVHWLTADDYVVQISAETVAAIKKMGFAEPAGFVPEELASYEALSSFKNIAVLAIGGLFVGFGARWAGGCTSGHAISGISDLQPSSLVAVVGFFIGGLVMTHLLMPLIFQA